MVAGQPIQTQAQTAEFDEGYDRIFGKDRKPQRGRFVFNAETGVCEEVGADWTDAERRAPTLTEELVHGKTKTTDGVDISSRKKRREYMQATGVADSGDFSSGWYERKNKDIRTDQDRQRKADIIDSFKRWRRE
jgi:hypothetical protein